MKRVIVISNIKVTGNAKDCLKNNINRLLKNFKVSYYIAKCVILYYFPYLRIEALKSMLLIENLSSAVIPEIEY